MQSARMSPHSAENFQWICLDSVSPVTEAQNPQLTFDCQKLRLYAIEFHQDTTFGDLTEDEQLAALPLLRKFASLPALERVRQEGLLRLNPIFQKKLSELIDEHCSKKKQNNQYETH